MNTQFLTGCLQVIDRFLNKIQKIIPINFSQSNQYSWQLITLLAVFSCIFSIAIRYLWVFYYNHPTSEFFNGDFIMNNNDGYFFAKGAMDILDGSQIQNDSRTPSSEPLAVLSAALAYILPFSLNKVVFYMPAYVSALLAVTTLLLGTLIVNLRVGFVAALMTSITWSYYNRTMMGYYDTDMMNVVFPVLLVWALTYAIIKRHQPMILIIPCIILMYRLWYGAGFTILFMTTLMFLLYAFIYDRKSTYLFKIGFICLLALVKVPLIEVFYLFVPIAAVYFCFTSKKLEPYFWYICLIIVAFFLFFGGVDPIVARFKSYLLRSNTLVVGDNETLQLQFYSVHKTVREAGKIPFEVLANRISGNVFIFIISLVGCVYLLFKKRLMWLSLPMIVLGLLAYVAGLRFTIYAIPGFALGFAFLLDEIAKLLQSKVATEPTMKIGVKNLIRYLKPNLLAVFFLTVGLSSSIYANVNHILRYKPPSVFTKEEVKQLVDFKAITKRDDYIISWWDFGYPLRYYGDIKTLVDGGKHSGRLNYGPSFILTRPPTIAAKMARLEVEFSKKAFLAQSSDGNWSYSSNIEAMTKEFGYSNTNDFLRNLRNLDIGEKVTKTSEVFLYLTEKNSRIYSTIGLFSYLDLMTGERQRQPRFLYLRAIKSDATNINFNRGVSFSRKKGTVVINNSETKVKNVHILSGRKKGKHRKQVYHQAGQLNLIVNASTGRGYVLDNAAYNSLFVQLYYLEKYDPNLFELVNSSFNAKIYKLKI